MRTRKRGRRGAPDELESWLHDLVGGEATARKLRERLRAEGATSEDSCSVCADLADHDRHLHEHHSA